MNMVVRIFMYLIFFIGILGASKLVIHEYRVGNVCPKIMMIPACYLILISLLIALLAQVFVLNNKVFYIPVLFAFSIALLATILELAGIVQCPKTDDGIPMCYYSLAIFSGLLVTKKILLF